jgi:hypothetical protein
MNERKKRKHAAAVRILTVVLIHIRQATLAPMATAPAVPPLTADAPALLMISSKVGGVFSAALAAFALVLIFLSRAIVVESIDRQNETTRVAKMTGEGERNRERSLRIRGSEKCV